MTARYCITLVHGTFAMEAPWTQPGSSLCRILDVELGREVLFKTFGWDAKNDDESRRAAAEALVNHQERLLSEHPDAVHAVIAHSHGGNIVLRAAADPRIATSLDRLVCMSAPFFLPSPRDVVTTIVRMVRGFLWFFGFTALIYSLIYSATFSRLVRRFGMSHSADERLLWFIAAVISIAGAIALTLSHSKIRAWISERQRERINEITLPKLSSTPVLCIWAKGDEVLFGFRTLDGLAGLTLLLLRPKSVATVLVLALLWLAPAWNDPIQRIFYTFGTDFARLVVLPFWPFAVIWEYLAGLLGINVSMALPLAVFAIAAITITLLSFGSFLAAAVLHMFLKLAPFGMNSWRLIDTFFLRIAPAPTPPDTSSVEPQQLTLPFRLLMHSSIYGNEIALRQIATFIREGRRSP